MNDRNEDPAIREPAHDKVRGRNTRTGIYAITGGLLLFLFAIMVRDEFAFRGRENSPPAANVPLSFTPPPMSKIPDGPEGASIRHGMAIFENTGTEAKPFVGNQLACRSCHLDAGRKADSAPMWAAWVSYPQYRAKNKKMNTSTDMCFFMNKLCYKLKKFLSL